MAVYSLVQGLQGVYGIQTLHPRGESADQRRFVENARTLKPKALHQTSLRARH